MDMAVDTVVDTAVVEVVIVVASVEVPLVVIVEDFDYSYYSCFYTLIKHFLFLNAKVVIKNKTSLFLDWFFMLLFIAVINAPIIFLTYFRYTINIYKFFYFPFILYHICIRKNKVLTSFIKLISF